jgi:hypothetical protein
MLPDSIKHFDNIKYLAQGNQLQQSAYAVLKAVGIFDKLQPYEPLLVGTIPIDIAIEGSDLDVICYCTDMARFMQDVERYFGAFRGFSTIDLLIGGIQSVVAGFRSGAWDIEIFGQAIPVKQQNGYRHMIAEYELLLKHGEPLRRQVIQLKQQGIKTEPAFAKALGLPGDPYQALLDLYPL